MKGDVTPAIPEGRQIIEGYGDGGFRVSGARYEGSVIVLVDRVVPWGATDPADITAESLQPLIDADVHVELLLIGCGKEIRGLPPEARKLLRAAGIAAEPMDTGAACRTYNLLLAEERHVAAALIAVS